MLLDIRAVVAAAHRPARQVLVVVEVRIDGKNTGAYGVTSPSGRPCASRLHSTKRKCPMLCAARRFA